jgi:hypothetical protein
MGPLVGFVVCPYLPANCNLDTLAREHLTVEAIARQVVWVGAR